MSGQLGAPTQPTGKGIRPPHAIGASSGGYIVPWQKGQSGNPGGQNLAKYARVRKLAAECSEEAINGLFDLMRNSTDDRVRYMAIMAVLERGIGKPRDHSSEEQAMAGMDLSKLSLADQEQLASMLRRMLGMAEKPAVDVESTAVTSVNGNLSDGTQSENK